MTARSSLTQLLEAAAGGDHDARATLVNRVYDELRGMARQHMMGERAGHSLGATDLVHEAYLRLTGPERDGTGWSSRAAFFHAAAEAMRRVLIDHARRKGAMKRGGGRKRVILDVLDVATRQDLGVILAIDEAIENLREWDPRLGELVHLRFYCGLGIDDTAAALGVSPRTVRRDWTFARAWLYRALHGEDGDVDAG